MSYFKFENRPPGFEQSDVIIVGSGPSGLICGNLLARYGGKKVLILEKHPDTPGGGLHHFITGHETCTPGFHYLGALTDLGEAMWSICTDDQPCTTSDSNEVYDNTRVGAKNYALTAANFEEMFGIRRSAFRAVTQTYVYLVAVKLLWWPFAIIAWIAYIVTGSRALAGMNYTEWCRKHTSKDKKDITSDTTEIWNSQEMDHGMERNETCAAVGCGATLHYCNGVVRMQGGVQETVRRMCHGIKERNGCVLVNAEVSAITFDESSGAANGVVCNGVNFNAPVVVVLNVDPLVKLCGPAKRVPADIKHAQDVLGPSVAYSCVFLTFRDKTAAELDLPPGNQWIDATYFISHKSSQHGTLVYILWKAEYFPRSTDYERKKEDASDESFQAIAKIFPKLRDFTTFDSSTPATNETWLAAVKGCSYGISQKPERFTDYSLVRALRPETSISGLYLSGQDAFLPGTFGSMVNGIITAQSILRPGIYDLLFNNFIFEVVKDHEKAKKKNSTGETAKSK